MLIPLNDQTLCMEMLFNIHFLIIKHHVQCVNEIHKVEKVLFFLQTKPTMKIFIKTSSDDTIPLEVKESYTIQDVKIKIQDQLSIPPDQYHLTLNGKQLEDKRLLFHYKVQNESLLQLTNRNGNAT